METRHKLVLSALGVALTGFLGPIAGWGFGTRGYFSDGFCACGNEGFVRIQGDAYFKYSPGHEVPEHRAFTIRVAKDGWEVLRNPNPDPDWSPVLGENKVVARIRFSDGAIYESWGSGTDWRRLPKVHNIWRVWWAKLVKK